MTGQRLLKVLKWLQYIRMKKEFERELNAKMNELQDVDIVPIVIDSKEEALAILAKTRYDW